MTIKNVKGNKFVRRIINGEFNLKGITIEPGFDLAGHKKAQAFMREIRRTLSDLVFYEIRGGFDISSGSFIEIKAAGLSMMRMHAEGANFFGADLEKADLPSANLERSNLYGANLREAKLPYVSFDKADLREANFYEADIELATFIEANLKEANLKRAYARYAIFSRANLEGANLEEANMEEADLRGANLYGANFRGTNLKRTDLRDANLTAVINLHLARNLKHARPGSECEPIINKAIKKKREYIKEMTMQSGNQTNHPYSA